MTSMHNSSCTMPSGVVERTVVQLHQACQWPNALPDFPIVARETSMNSWKHAATDASRSLSAAMSSGGLYRLPRRPALAGSHERGPHVRAVAHEFLDEQSLEDAVARRDAVGVGAGER